MDAPPGLDAIVLPVLSASAARVTKNSFESMMSRIKDLVKTASIALPGVVASVCDTMVDVAGVFANPPTDSKEVFDGFVYDNLTEKELATAVFYAQMDVEIRSKLVGLVKPLLENAGASDPEFLKAFSLNSFDDLEDEKGQNAFVAGVRQEASGDRFIRRVYYCRALVKRQDRKYTLFVAYCSMDFKMPYYSLRALLQSDDDLRMDITSLGALAFHRLHHRLASLSPKIKTREVDDPLLLTC